MEQNLQSVGYLVQREIQAPLLANLLKDFIAEIGYEKAMAIASKTIQKDGMKAGRKMAEKYGGNGIAELLRVIQEVWAHEKALELEVLEETENRLRFNVTRCRYAELYDRLGIREFGYCFSCNRDEPLIKAFNSRMKLLRTQTIMEGDPICDFLIILE
jgi:hypothetical protein